jgi:hypothetical protein
MAMNQEKLVSSEERLMLKEQVREFYNEIGWREVSQGIYQNASYEDLRPVSRDYIHRCHLRVMRYLESSGIYLLDAGSGPIQYPEYLEYSRGYQFRVCADLSIVALKEAQKRIGGHGLFVVADIASLPFKPGVFQGVVSLHTIHHLLESEHLQAYRELYRVLAVGARGVVVNGWKYSPLMQMFEPLLRRLKQRIETQTVSTPEPLYPASKTALGTFVNKNNASWLKREIGQVVPLKIYCWRSISVGFMRALIHPRLGGRLWLRLIYWLEDLFPQFLGEKGQYPLVVIYKRDNPGSKE